MPGEKNYITTTYGRAHWTQSDGAQTPLMTMDFCVQRCCRFRRGRAVERRRYWSPRTDRSGRGFSDREFFQPIGDARVLRIIESPAGRAYGRINCWSEPRQSVVTPSCQACLQQSLGTTLVRWMWHYDRTDGWPCDHFVDKASAISQPTWPTQPAIPPKSVKWVVIH